jgi:hypothetical protein
VLIPGAGCAAIDERPYETTLLKEEIPISALTDDNPYDIILLREDTPISVLKDERP